MPDLKPFAGVRYTDAARLTDLVSPPYDVISPEEQAELYERHSNNAVRLELPKAETPHESREQTYKGAAARFREWLDSGVLAKDDSDSYYVYRQDFVTPAGKRTAVTGVIGALTLEPFGSDSGVLPHERTMPGPKKDRLTLMRALPVNVSPIYGIYRGGGELGAFLDSLQHRPTAGRLSDASGSLHRLWVISASAEVDMLRSAIGKAPLVIADGHHRYETALGYHEERGGGQGGHDSIMTFAVDADAGGLEVLPYNRALKTRVSPEEVRTALSDRFQTKTLAPGEGNDALQNSDADHPLLFVLPQDEVLVEVSDDEIVEHLGTAAPAWRALDVVALHEVVLPKAVREVAEIVFSHDPAEVISLVREQGWSAGVLLKPLMAAEVIDVATSGERMPQKASYFWPKAVTGFVFRELDQAN